MRDRYQLNQYCCEVMIGTWKILLGFIKNIYFISVIRESMLDVNHFYGQLVGLTPVEVRSSEPCKRVIGHFGRVECRMQSGNGQAGLPMFPVCNRCSLMFSILPGGYVLQCHIYK